MISVFSFNTHPWEAKRNFIHHFQGFLEIYSLNLTGTALHYSPKTLHALRLLESHNPEPSVISVAVFRDLSSNKFVCDLPVFAVQSGAPVDEVTCSIIHLLRQVIKRCHSLPKLGLIIPAVQAVFPASCSSPLTDQDIHPKERHTYWSDCNSQNCTHTLSKPLLTVFPLTCLFIFFDKSIYSKKGKG